MRVDFRGLREREGTMRLLLRVMKNCTQVVFENDQGEFEALEGKMTFEGVRCQKCTPIQRAVS